MRCWRPRATAAAVPCSSSASPASGKTSLLGRPRRHRGMRELTVTGYEAESTIPYAALHRLMLPLRPHVAALSEAPPAGAAGRGRVPCRAHRPTASSSGWACSHWSPPRARTTPLVCAVDDAHHLDAESLEALTFVARRLEAESAALLFAGPRRARLIERAAGVPVLRLAGLDPDAAVSLLQAALPEPIDPAAAAQIATATGGNPLALLDLASELDARRLTESSLADEPIPVGHHLEAFYLRRVRHLTPDLQLWLLVAAADSTGNLDLIRSAAKELGVCDVAGEGAELAGLVTLGGAVEFRHPLVRSAVYNAAPGPDRRRVHRALSLAAADLGLVELEAWHASKATLGTDPEVADRLERVADLAGARGGFLSRASVLAQAAALTPAGETKDARLVGAAEAALAAGAVQVSNTLLDDVDPDQRVIRHCAAGRSRCARPMPLFIGDPALVHGAADMLDAAECFHGIDDRAEQAALIRAFEFTSPGRAARARALTLRRARAPAASRAPRCRTACPPPSSPHWARSSCCPTTRPSP